MNLTQLPPEVQFNYLLQLSPPESICNNEYFWNEKAKYDFGYSMQMLCQMHPYWQYQFADSLMDTAAAIIPPLVRAGQTQVVENLLTDPTVSLQQAITNAVTSNDLTTLRYFRDYFQSLEDIGCVQLYSVAQQTLSTI